MNDNARRFEEVWRLRCRVCDAAEWKPAATEAKRVVFKCLSCGALGQVDLESEALAAVRSATSDRRTDA